MTKEIEKKTCNYCESDYKLMFELGKTSGFPKFCPFCGNETYDEDVPFDEDEIET
jgi:hypothetical protein